MRIDYNLGVDSIHQRIDQIKLTNLDSITQSLWTLDLSSLKIQLHGLSRINDFIYIKITDDKNNIVADSGKINTENIITDKIELKQLYRGQKLYLGTLTIVATKENIYQQLLDTVIVILISQAIKTFMVSIFILIIFHYLITRHLNKIAQHSINIKLTSSPEALILDRKNSFLYKNDDLDRVVNSINNMSNNIYESYKNILSFQHELSNREAKFSAIFDSFYDSIIFENTQRKILQTNPAFNTQFGYHLNDIKNKSALILYDNPDDYVKQVKSHLNSEKKPDLSIYEINFRRKDGSIFISETMGGAIKLNDGSLIGYISIIRDISNKKSEEKEKKLLQSQLQQSQKMKSLGQLTGGIAHDFNNIISSIVGYTNLSLELLNDSTDALLINHIKRIEYAGERAQDLIKQLLTFSRNSPSKPKTLELPPLINDVVSLIRPGIPPRIEIEIKIEKNIPPVLMDTTQMNQLLMNLCINARDSIRGQGKITIILNYDKNIHDICNSCKNNIQGDYVKLTVKDTGTGIPQKILNSIFDPFLTTKEDGQGTGMGLSVVHGILHSHKSHVVIDSDIKVGSKFHLLIPPTNKNNTH